MNESKGFGLIGILTTIAVIAVLTAGGVFAVRGTDRAGTTHEDSESAIQKAKDTKQELEERNQDIDAAITDTES